MPVVSGISSPTMAARGRVIYSAAPIRICDNGGWTDTWFARHGAVLNIAVHPQAEVKLRATEAWGEETSIFLHAEDYGASYGLDPQRGSPGPHPLLEEAIWAVGVPNGLRLEVWVHSDAPPGAGTGTSSAVTVALIAALDALTPGRLAPHDVADAAHRVETELLGQQCGVQDQLASAYGGINFIEIGEYPRAVVTTVAVSDELWWELERRLLLVSLGAAHDSSALHEQVIARLADAGPEAPALRDLRLCAARSRDALLVGDLAAFGQAMVANTESQGRLHPALVSKEAAQVIAIAREHGALGWKVNGAGGEGGSLTLLCSGDHARKSSLIREIEQEDPAFRRVPTRLSRHGVQVGCSPRESPRA
jgi:D-glycero-alpha-D-manno-heptose-7-phosphate kinase